MPDIHKQHVHLHRPEFIYFCGRLYVFKLYGFGEARYGTSGIFDVLFRQHLLTSR
jgi:hypothetical protein